MLQVNLAMKDKNTMTAGMKEKALNLLLMETAVSLNRTARIKRTNIDSPLRDDEVII